MNARRAQPGYHEVAPLDMRVWRVRAETGAARVPAEVVQFVTGIRHRHAADDLAVARRGWIDIDDRDFVGVSPLRVEARHVSEALGRRARGHARRRIKARIGGPGNHRFLPFAASTQGVLVSSKPPRARIPFLHGVRFEAALIYP